MIIQLRTVFCPLVQYLSCFCARFSWKMLDSSSLPLSRWYALLLSFFLKFSSISLHCSPIQFSFAFFMHLLMLLFTSLHFQDPSGSNLFFLSSLLLLHRSRISAVTQGFFFWRFCKGSHWLFQSLLCWRWWSLSPCLYLHCSWWWEVQTSCLS